MMGRADSAAAASGILQAAGVWSVVLAYRTVVDVLPAAWQWWAVWPVFALAVVVAASLLWKARAVQRLAAADEDEALVRVSTKAAEPEMPLYSEWGYPPDDDDVPTGQFPAVSGRGGPTGTQEIAQRLLADARGRSGR